MAYRNHRNVASRPNIYQIVTDRIITSLKAGVIPWEKPWKTPRYAGGPFPRNSYTGNAYWGINVLLLWSSEYSSPFLLAFKQPASPRKRTMPASRRYLFPREIEASLTTFPSASLSGITRGYRQSTAWQFRNSPGLLARLNGPKEQH